MSRSAPEESADIDIKVAEVEKTYSVSGRVVNADDGKPVSGAKVELSLVSPDSDDIRREGSSNGHSDSKGDFQLSNVPPGKYIAYTAVNLEPDNAFNLYCEPVICEVTNSDVHGDRNQAPQGRVNQRCFNSRGSNRPGNVEKRKLCVYFTAWKVGLES